MFSYSPFLVLPGEETDMKPIKPGSSIGKSTWIAVFLIVLAVFFLFRGIQGTSYPENISRQENTTGKVVVSVVEPNDARIADLISEIETAVDNLGMELIYDKPEEYSSAWQQRDISRYLDGSRQDIRYLVLLPSSRTGLKETLEEAKENGIRVILVTNQADSYEDCDAGIVVDYEKEGRMCAEYLAARFEGQDASIIEIRESSGSKISNLRSSGFEGAIASFDNLHIEETGQGNGNIQSARSVMTDIIRRKSKGEIDAVFSCSDEDGIGALYSFKLAGYTASDYPLMISVSGSQDILKVIAAGEYTATLKTTQELGNVIAQRLTMLEQDGVVPDKYTTIGNEIIDESNVYDYLSE